MSKWVCMYPWNILVRRSGPHGYKTMRRPNNNIIFNPLKKNRIIDFKCATSRGQALLPSMLLLCTIITSRKHSGPELWSETPDVCFGSKRSLHTIADMHTHEETWYTGIYVWLYLVVWKRSFFFFCLYKILIVPFVGCACDDVQEFSNFGDHKSENGANMD